MRLPPIDQLRCLGDDDPESVYSHVWIYWQDKQAYPVGNVNVHTLMSEMYRRVEEQSPALKAMNQNKIDNDRRSDPTFESRFEAFLDSIADQVEAAHRLEDYYGGWG